MCGNKHSGMNLCVVQYNTGQKNYQSFANIECYCILAKFHSRKIRKESVIPNKCVIHNIQF